MSGCPANTKHLSPQEFRKSNSGFFKHSGKYLGFKVGVMNGPEASTDRGRRRVEKRKGG